MNDPIIGETVQITQIQACNGECLIIGAFLLTLTQVTMPVLKEMVNYTMPGAQYDSDARDSPPKCHPGTRTQIPKTSRLALATPT